MVRRGFESDAAHLAADRMGPGGPNHAIPVSKAGAAIVRAVERRARRAYAPRWILPLLLGRTLFQPLQERQAVRMGVADILDRASHEHPHLTTDQPREHHL